MLKTPRKDVDFLPSGRFTVGANYWASHAGLHMWEDWRPEVVESDLGLLAAAGLKVLRVFPLWPDFQPIHQMRGYAGTLREIRHGDEPLPNGPNGVPDGVSPVMLARFRSLADMAGRHDLSLIVGLVTGWMSGRLLVPPALEGLNPITDPTSLMWQARMVRRIVQEFRNHPAIAAWDLGNECNCMGVANREQGWTWTATLTGTIRGEDRSRPIISGMHSLPADPAAAWSISDQGELTDVLTTHPYPLWTPHCDQDTLASFRPALHAACETQLYGDLSGRPAFAEEIGMMGPMVADEAASAEFARASLFSLWAHDGRAALWWCAYDQGHLTRPPYDWLALETELGMMRADGTPKPVLREFGAVYRAIQELPFHVLPRRRVEAVCILSPGQDSWGVGQSAFLLAKQAGFDLTFAYAGSEIPEAELYLVPSLNGHTALYRHQSEQLMERVEKGATLYLSIDDAFVARFEEFTGLLVRSRHKRTAPQESSFDAISTDLKWTSTSPLQFSVSPTRAEVLGGEADGNPIFSCAQFGKGRVYFLGFGLEAEMSHRPGVFKSGPEMWRLYERMAKDATTERALRKSLGSVGITEHPLSDRERIAVLINYARQSATETIELAEGWNIAEVYRGFQPKSDGASLTVELNGMDAAVWLVARS